MLEVGLTGGIGSGKTTVARIFEVFGYQVYYADVRAKALYTENQAVQDAVIDEFGADIYTPEGQLDRGKLAGIVFNDKARLQKLNQIVHPATAMDFVQWRARLLDSGYDRPFILKEAAILFESGSYKGMDKVLSIYAPKHVRLQRVLQRDGAVVDEVLARMDKQYPESFKLFHADFVLYNDGTHTVIPQVQAAINFFQNG